MNIKVLIISLFLVICLITSSCSSAGIFDNLFKSDPNSDNLVDSEKKIEDNKSIPVKYCLSAPIKSGYNPYDNILIKTLAITPESKVMNSGEEVSMAVGIVFTPNSNRNTIDPNHFIDLYTDLENPRWSYDIIVNGIENKNPVLTKNRGWISGWLLSFDDSNVVLKMKLDGKMPVFDNEKQMKTPIIAKIILDKNDGYFTYELVNISTGHCM